MNDNSYNNNDYTSLVKPSSLSVFVLMFISVVFMFSPSIF